MSTVRATHVNDRKPKAAKRKKKKVRKPKKETDVDEFVEAHEPTPITGKN